MMKKLIPLIALLTICAAAHAAAALALLPMLGEAQSTKAGTVSESERLLPLAYDVDVVIAGGSLAGVEAACAAADNGASVLVVESRPYLGYDICVNQKCTNGLSLICENYSKRQISICLLYKH